MYRLPWWLLAVAGVTTQWWVPALADALGASPRALPHAVIVAVATLLLLLAAVALASRVRRAWRLRAARSVGRLARIDWKAFEELVIELYRRRGYRASATRRGPDGGVDVIVEARDMRAIVQAKHWPGRAVGAAVVRELYGLLDDFDADRAVVVTSGRFSPAAFSFAEGKPVELVDGEALVDAARALRRLAPTGLDDEEVAATRRCPHCGGEL